MNPMSIPGQAANGKAKTGRTSSWLIGILLLGNVADFSEMPANAQTSLLDDHAPMAFTTTPSRLSNATAAYDEAMSNTARSPTSARVIGQDAEPDGQPKNTAAQDAGQAASLFANPLWGLPLKQFSVTRERPIFSPSRRPPPPAPTYVAPVAVKRPSKLREPERPTIALAGTIIGTDGYRGAVFRDTSSQNVLRLRVGEDYQGWVLLLITPHEARLVKNGEHALVELPVPAGTPPRARSSHEIALEQIWAVGAE